MSFIKELFNKGSTEESHRQFSRFSKGIFENRAVLDITNSKKVKIKTSAEFTNELVKLLALTIENKTLVKGIVFSTRDLSQESNIKFEDIKSAMGIKKHIVNSELTKEDILNLTDKFPHSSINLSFKTPYGEIKVKEKAPKSGKPGKKDEEPKPDYCTFVTEDKNILKEYAFDVENFKKLKIKHTFEILDIEIPEEYKNDFKLAREKAIRKGIIHRFLDIDGSKKETKIEFKA